MQALGPTSVLSQYPVSAHISKSIYWQLKGYWKALKHGNEVRHGEVQEWPSLLCAVACLLWTVSHCNTQKEGFLLADVFSLWVYSVDLKMVITRGIVNVWLLNKTCKVCTAVAEPADWERKQAFCEAEEKKKKCVVIVFFQSHYWMLNFSSYTSPAFWFLLSFRWSYVLYGHKFFKCLEEFWQFVLLHFEVLPYHGLFWWECWWDGDPDNSNLSLLYRSDRHWGNDLPLTKDFPKNLKLAVDYSKIPSAYKYFTYSENNWKMCSNSPL